MINDFTEEEISQAPAERAPLPEGLYSFEVTECTEVMSPMGQPQFALRLAVNKVDEPMTGGRVRDWLPHNKELKWRVAQFIKASGRQYLFKQREIMASDLENAKGQVMLKHREGKDGRIWANVDKYVADTRVEDHRPAEQTSKDPDDDIPF